MEATASFPAGSRRWRHERALLVAAAPMAWLWLQAPVVAWLWNSLPTPEYASSLVLLLAAGGWLAARAVRAWRAGHRAVALPTLRPVPLALALGGAAGSVALRMSWDADLPSAALAMLSAYGLAGLHVSPPAWRRAAPGTLLLIAALPFGAHADAYLGFPARLATAELVHALFSAAGVPSASAQTVLLLENGAMNVDIPCSGIRGVWTGLLFFLGATCLERPRLGLRWLAAGATYLVLLLGANAARVATISLVSGVAGQAGIARLFHEPLGVAGFALASMAAWTFLRPLRASGEPPPAAPSTSAPRWLPLALAAAFALLGLARRPFAPEVAPPARPLALPPSLAAAEVPLSGAETRLYRRHGGAAGKWRLLWQGHGVSLLVVHASSFRAHHPPEQCLRATGLAIDADVPLRLRPGFDVRWLRVEGGRAAAVYWFQSPRGQVNSLAARVAADLGGGERRWALVTAVVDRPPADPDRLVPLLDELRAAVAASFPRDPP